MAEGSAQLSSVLQGMLGSGGSMRMNAHKRALSIWMRVNGDIERKHTCGVFIKPVPHADPALTVYLDSRGRVVDFNANRELYLQRLAYQGLPLSKIEFKLSKDVPSRASAVEEAEARADELPELSADELSYVEECVENLLEPLRTSVSKAMIFSMRREKAQEAQKTN